MQIRPVAIEGLARKTRWDPLLVVPAGNPGWVECRAFDAWCEVRLNRVYTEGINSVEREVDQRVFRIGPAGSAHLFWVGPEGGLIEYRTRQVLNSGTHINPSTGLYNGSGTLDTRITARHCVDRPETYEEYAFSYGTSGTTDCDAAAIAASSTSSRLYPTGYCRQFSFRAISPTGTLDIYSPLLDGLGTANAVDVQTYEETLSASGSGVVSAWNGIVISNDNASTALACSLYFRSPERC